MVQAFLGEITMRMFTWDEVLSPYIYVFYVAFAVAFVFTPLMRVVALNFGIIDAPDRARKMHSVPVAYLGGVAVFGKAVRAHALVDGAEKERVVERMPRPGDSRLRVNDHILAGQTRREGRQQRQKCGGRITTGIRYQPSAAQRRSPAPLVQPTPPPCRGPNPDYHRPPRPSCLRSSSSCCQHERARRKDTGGGAFFSLLANTRQNTSNSSQLLKPHARPASQPNTCSRFGSATGAPGGMRGQFKVRSGGRTQVAGPGRG